MPFTRTLVKIMTLRCREATELISAAMDEEGELRLGDRVAVRLHTLICGPCRRFRTQLDRVRQWLRDGESLADTPTAPPPVPGGRLSEDARQRLDQLIRENT
jgi:hypothetical protein